MVYLLAGPRSYLDWSKVRLSENFKSRVVLEF